MAITFNTASQAYSSTTTTSVTFSHTSNSDPLIVRLHMRGTPASITVTYNGTSVPAVTNCTKQGNAIYAAIHYLATPANGTYDVVVSWTGGCGYCINAVNISGAGSPVNGNSASASSNTPSVDITSATGSTVIDACSFYSNSTLTVGASQTQQYNQDTGAGAALLSGAGSYESGAATVTMSWSASGSDDWAIVGCSFPEASTATAQVIWFS